MMNVPKAGTLMMINLMVVVMTILMTMVIMKAGTKMATGGHPDD